MVQEQSDEELIEIKKVEPLKPKRKKTKGKKDNPHKGTKPPKKKSCFSCFQKCWKKRNRPSRTMNRPTGLEELHNDDNKQKKRVKYLWSVARKHVKSLTTEMRRKKLRETMSNLLQEKDEGAKKFL